MPNLSLKRRVYLDSTVFLRLPFFLSVENLYAEGSLRDFFLFLAISFLRFAFSFEERPAKYFAGTLGCFLVFFMTTMTPQRYHW